MTVKIINIEVKDLKEGTFSHYEMELNSINVYVVIASGLLDYMSVQYKPSSKAFYCSEDKKYDTVYEAMSDHNETIQTMIYFAYLNYIGAS